MTRSLWLLCYYGFARWLPSSTAPGGSVGKRLRAFLASHLLAVCGDCINVERGAYFGTGQQVLLGNRSGIGISSRLIGPVTIGNDVMMGPNVLVLTANHRFEDTTRPMVEQGASEVRPVAIEDDVWIGTNVIILPGLTVHRGSVIGAGAVVTSDIPPFTVAAGNPARQIRKRGAV